MKATRDQLQARFSALLASPVASQVALVSFWAVVGLIAYLIAWGGYNIIIEARNEVTLSTAYTNRGHWRGPFETLALKAAAAIGLALVIGSLWLGVSFWLSLSASVAVHVTLASAGTAALAVLGLTAQLYLALMFAQLTFTPWYRPQAFTDN